MIPVTIIPTTHTTNPTITNTGSFNFSTSPSGLLLG